MTDGVRHARWQVAAVLAPATAAVFASSVGWASAHQPAQQATQAPKLTSTTAPLAAAPQADPQLEAAIRAQITEVEALRKKVADLRKQVDLLRTGASAPRTTGKSAGTATTTTRRSSSSGSSSGSSSSSSSRSQAAPVAAAPAPVAAPAPAPAPATNTTTGGS